MKETDNVFSYANERGSHRGLTARDYIAIQAMTAIISNASYVPEYSATEVAHLAYIYADEMVKRSNQ